MKSEKENGGRKGYRKEPQGKVVGEPEQVNQPSPFWFVCAEAPGIFTLFQQQKKKDYIQPMSQVFPSPLCYTDIEEDIFYMGFHTERVGGVIDDF